MESKEAQIKKERELNVQKVLLEMFSQRGYVDVKLEDDIISGYDGEEKVISYATIIERLNTDEIKKRISLMKEEDITHCLLVYEGLPTTGVKKVIADISELGLTIELFHSDDLQMNITKHYLSCKHEGMSEEDIKKIKDKNNLPIILKSDPVCRFYNFEKGTVIRIYRKDGSIAYRIVR